MANLFEIVNQLDNIFDVIEDNEGVLDENLLAQLSISEEMLQDKLEAYALYLKQQKSNIQVLKDEIELFKRKIETINKNSEWLKEQMTFAVTRFGEQKPNGNYGIKTSKYSFWTQVTESVVIDDDFEDNTYVVKDIKVKSLNQDEFKTLFGVITQNVADQVVDVTPRVDKKALKEALKSGEEVEHAMLVRIKGIRMR